MDGSVEVSHAAISYSLIHWTAQLKISQKIPSLLWETWMCIHEISLCRLWRPWQQWEFSLTASAFHSTKKKIITTLCEGMEWKTSSAIQKNCLFLREIFFIFLISPINYMACLTLYCLFHVKFYDISQSKSYCQSYSYLGVTSEHKSVCCFFIFVWGRRKPNKT